MRSYNIFTAIPLSFFSRKLYADVIQNWRGTAFSYLFVVLILVWVPLFILYSSEISTFIDTEGQQVVKLMPNITIKNGELSIDKPVPYIIRDEETKEVMIVIDTSGKITSPKQTKAKILITKNQVFFQKNDVESRSYSLKTIDDFEVTQELATKFLGWLEHWVLVMLFPMAVFFSFLYRMVQAFIYAIIGALIIAPLSKKKLTYAQVLRVCAVGVTPAIIIATGLEFAHVGFPLRLLAFFLLTMAYVTFGINSIKQDENATQQD